MASCKTAETKSLTPAKARLSKRLVRRHTVLGGKVLDDYAYRAAITELQATAVATLRAAGGRPDLVRDAILSYLRDGYRLDLSPSELTDFFCVSTPNIVEAAGYTDAGGDAIVALYDELHNQVRRTAL
jgi:hypothetical protein